MDGSSALRWIVDGGDYNDSEGDTSDEEVDRPEQVDRLTLYQVCLALYFSEYFGYFHNGYSQ